MVVIHTDEGISGVGDTALYPRPRAGAETQTSVLHCINEFLEPVLLGEDPLNLEKLVHAMNKKIAGNLRAKSAVDIALHDLIGKKLGTPLFKLLGGRFREKIPMIWAMGIASEKETVERAQWAVKRGFKAIKLKVGLDITNDEKRVNAVRKSVGDNIPIHVDANGAWNSRQAIKAIKKLERYNLQLVEQPVPGWDLEGMAEVASSVKVPVMADESLNSPQSAIEIIRKNAASVFNLKPSKSGGLMASRKIASIAEAANIPCMVSSLQMCIGTAAQVHLATACRMVAYPCALSGSIKFAKNIVKNKLEIEDGFLTAPEAPGLGMEIDYDKLNALRS